ncbi:MAG: Ig-like domain-containing protein [Pseudomonadota bacterium]
MAIAIAAVLSPGSAFVQESIELSQLDGSNGFVLFGIDANDFSGRSVSGAGDVNGDGIDDVIIGADLADPGTSNEGETYVVFGRATGFPASLNLADLDGSTGFLLEGIDASDFSGDAVSGAGDVNGDGIDDLIIGAYGADQSADYEGETYVVFGRTTGFPASLNLASLDGSSGFVLNGIDNYDRSGRSVSGAGDVNGDGIDDVIIGAPYAGSGTNYEGETYVVFGSDSGFPASLNLADLDGSDGFVLNGIDAGDFSGRSVSGAGDVNGDGIDDVILGAYLADLMGTSEGETYIVFGRATGFPASLNLADLDGSSGFLLNGIGANDRSGRSVSGAGDINGDGIDDVIIGAYFANSNALNEGETYVVFGTDLGFPASFNLADLDGSSGFVLTGIDANDLSGRSVNGAGDVNGDGIDDVIIGAYLANPGVNNGGETYVVFGSDSGFPASLNLADLDGSNGFVLNGVDADDRSGRSVSRAGDVNGDGIDDVIIGADSADPSADDEGETYVVFGNAAPLRVGGATSFLLDELEDDANASGSRLDVTVALNYLDVDAFGGVGVIGDSSTPGQGQWQYALNGVDWQDLPSALSDTSALVLGNDAWLRFVPALNYSGQPGGLAVRMWDGRWRVPGDSVDISSAVGALGGFASDENLLNVTLDIMPVNDAPSFVAADPPAVNEDPSGVTVSGWSAFDPGPNESNQFALTYQVAAVSNPGMFSVLPTIDTLGNLIYDPRQDVSGTSTFNVRVVDSGGMANGGVNVSGFQTFTITVNSVNDPPVLNADDPPPVGEDAGPQTVSNWASLDPGAPNEAGQQVTVLVAGVANPTLFTVPPTVDAAGTLTYTPAPGESGSSSFTVVASDNGGVANGGQDTSQPQIFTISIRADLLFSDSFE